MSFFFLSGCQSMGEHFNCLSEVDRLVPAQTQQKYVRTDTKCTRSNEQTVTGAFGSTWGTVYNPSQGDINCSSTPIYETIVLNQQQRDLAYQQCRNSYANNKVSVNRQSSNSDNLQRPGDVMSINQAKSLCTRINGFEEGTVQHTSCVLRAVQGR